MLRNARYCCTPSTIFSIKNSHLLSCSAAIPFGTFERDDRACRRCCGFRQTILPFRLSVDPAGNCETMCPDLGQSWKISATSSIDATARALAPAVVLCRCNCRHLLVITFSIRALYTLQPTFSESHFCGIPVTNGFNPICFI